MSLEVPLTRGFVAVIDDEDAAAVLGMAPWHAKVHRNLIYAARHANLPGGRRPTVRMHNFLTGWQYVDHVNGDGLDNRRSNLRESTHQQNLRNQRHHSNNTSGYTGVSFYPKTSRWKAYIGIEGRTRHIGYFSTPEEAARARDAAALEHFGPFARLNFPQESA